MLVLRGWKKLGHFQADNLDTALFMDGKEGKWQKKQKRYAGVFI